MSTDARSAPTWFTDALAQPGESGSVDVGGASIVYRAWGEPDTPGIVLIHGGMAHLHWWDHIAPLLADGRRVVALDLAGHGDSDRRADYRFEDFIDEVLAAARAGRIAGPPVLVGHSMGGIVAYGASVRCPEQIDGLVIFDSPIRDLTPAELGLPDHRTDPAQRIYATVDDALARYRLVPPQEHAEPYIRDHIGRASLTEVDGGWSWKFDHLRMQRTAARTVNGTRAGNRLAFFRSEHGIVSDELMAQIRPMLGDDAWLIELADAGHHPMFDQPLAMITGIRTVLAAWGR